MIKKIFGSSFTDWLFFMLTTQSQKDQWEKPNIHELDFFEVSSDSKEYLYYDSASHEPLSFEDKHFYFH